MSLGDRLQRIYWRLEGRLAPGVCYAQTTFEQVLVTCVEPGCHWLDLGCGHTLLPEWRAAQEEALARLPGRLVGLDPELEALRRHQTIPLRVNGIGERLPFADGSFHLVTANMVVEHLATPEGQFREVARVLRPGGRFVFHTPNATGYPTLLARSVPDAVRGWAARLMEARDESDRFRTYYRANTPAKIAAVAARSGLAVERLDLVRSNAMFARVTPVAVAELLLLRALAAPRLSWLRPNLIAVLRKSP